MQQKNQLILLSIFLNIFFFGVTICSENNIFVGLVSARSNNKFELRGVRGKSPDDRFSAVVLEKLMVNNEQFVNFNIENGYGKRRLMNSLIRRGELFLTANVNRGVVLLDQTDKKHIQVYGLPMFCDLNILGKEVLFSPNQLFFVVPGDDKCTVFANVFLTKKEGSYSIDYANFVQDEGAKTFQALHHWKGNELCVVVHTKTELTIAKYAFQEASDMVLHGLQANSNKILKEFYQFTTQREEQGRQDVPLMVTAQKIIQGILYGEYLLSFDSVLITDKDILTISSDSTNNKTKEIQL
jgi:hypothetical protein